MLLLYPWLMFTSLQHLEMLEHVRRSQSTLSYNLAPLSAMSCDITIHLGIMYMCFFITIQSCPPRTVVTRANPSS
jgi:hypothetical protein